VELEAWDAAAVAVEASTDLPQERVVLLPWMLMPLVLQEAVMTGFPLPVVSQRIMEFLAIFGAVVQSAPEVRILGACC
jgi:hypothetical protein